MLLCADSTGHVLLLVVKLVVASLGAADQLGQRVVLMIETSVLDYEREPTAGKQYKKNPICKGILQSIYTVKL